MNAMEFLKKRTVSLVLVGAVLVVLALNWQRVLAVAASAGPTPAHASERATVRSVHAEGRLVPYPGADVIVGTDVGGTIRALAVTEKASVKKGDLIAEIDAVEQKAALAEARARVNEADVEIRFSEVELSRAKSLFATNAIAKDAVDRSERDRDAAKARKDSAWATAARLGAVVSKTRIVAPIDGVVLNRFTEVGETVAPGAQLVRVADLKRTRIEAEVDEYDTGRIAVGSDVAIRAEGYAETWTGKVEEIPDAVTARRLKPQDPGRPSDTRVLLVKVALSQPTHIKLGQRVEVEIKSSP